MVALAAAGGIDREVPASAAGEMELTLGADVRRCGRPPDRPPRPRRVSKRAPHEVGHLGGSTHCDAPLSALMRSTAVRRLDAKGGAPCASCAILMRDAVAAARRSTRFDRSGGVT